ncbi:MAG TPA: M28 family peptidase [Fimbriiglobus sp.]|nr:M28 family peptidase [Fimbriiglobus sp.]
MRHRLLAAVGLLAVTSAAPAAEPALEQIKKDLFYLAGEECEGRGIETAGIRKAGAYIAAAFQEAGLKPAGTEGSYFQPFTVYGRPRLGTPNTLVLTGPNDRTLDLKYGEDFTPTGMSAAGKAEGGLVFVGYGITAPKLGYDDYAGADVTGKFVVVLRRTPRTEEEKNPFEKDGTPHADLVTKVSNAAKHGAAGVVFVNDATYGKGDDSLLAFRGGELAGLPVLHMKRAVLAKLLAAKGKKLTEIESSIDKNLKPRTVALTGWSAAAEVTVDRQAIPCRNVIAVAEGSGPLADETVVVGAHYDHLGRGEPGSALGAKGKGLVHYGADDNASGTTGLMELARRFGARKDRVGRRVVFVAFSGEERGLYGSKHYCADPPFPLAKTVFMLNMDMIGRVVEVDDDAGLVRLGSLAGAAGGSTAPGAVVKRDRVVVYGTGTAPGLDELLTEANRKFDFKLLRVPGGSGPSDHESFYLKHVPVLFFFTGIHRDYHRPTDTPEKVNLPGLKKVADLAEVLTSHFASATERPTYQATAGGWSDPTDDRPRVSRPQGPRLGIMPGNYEATTGGVLLDDVVPGGAAEKAGLKAKDVIVEIAGKPVRNINDYMTAMAGQKPGVAIDVVVVRQDKKLTVKVTPQAP